MPLDEVGVSQAAAAAHMLARLKPDVIIASDLMRAFDTGSALGSLCGLEVRPDAGLRETYVGTWQGRTHAELAVDHADDLRLWALGMDVRPGGGETRIEVAERAVAAINRALADVPDGGTLVAATHGGAARAAACLMLGLPLDHWTALGIMSNCAWTVLVENPAVVGSGAAVTPWRLQEYNAGTLPVPPLGDEQ